MQLTLAYSETIFPSCRIAKIGNQITAALLDWIAATGCNMTPSDVVMKVQEYPDGYTLVGGKVKPGVWLDCVTPPLVLASRPLREGFFTSATDILLCHAEGPVKPNQIHINLVHALEGTKTSDAQFASASQVKAAAVHETSQTNCPEAAAIDGSVIRSEQTDKHPPSLRDVRSHPFYFL